MWQSWGHIGGTFVSWQWTLAADVDLHAYMAVVGRIGS